MSKMQDLYTGAAGQAAVMAEFLIRGYNVAVPEVDRGDDLFVVQDFGGNYDRVQVKTAQAKALKAKGRYTARFSIPMVQLETPQADVTCSQRSFQAHRNDFAQWPVISH